MSHYGCQAPGGTCVLRLIGPDEAAGACGVCGERCVMVASCGLFVHSGCAPSLDMAHRAGMRGRPVTPFPAADIRHTDPAGRTTVWLGEQARRERDERPTTTRGPIQPALRADLAELLDARGLDEAVRLWNEHMRRIRYDGAHRTAYNLLNGGMKHASIPDLPPLAAGALAPLDEAPVFVASSWLTHDSVNGADQPGSVLAGYDVCGQYMGSAAIELGIGSPVRVDWPHDDVLALPGFSRVAALENAPWGVMDRFREDMWVPNPLVAYWRDAGAEMLISEGLAWPEHRRWLDPVTDLLRDARRQLRMIDSDAARALVKIVNDLGHRIFGGLLASSDHNGTTVTFHPEARAEIVGTSQARMFRALDKTRTLPGVGVVGFHADCAWFVIPEGFRHPPGLVVFDHTGPCPDKTCHQLGKFKPAGRVPWTDDLRAAWQDGSHRTLWKALHGRD